ncbi:diguanylate cyclase [Halomonas sp. YLGW01]|uniref:diguanylate cyclase n=1 Tax=Halomonas sp. YLGW01 TaxID=2773308 RepID=UPI00178688C3|nr:diguanylate cyclase [Halomonas sp. YLGW01]
MTPDAWLVHAAALHDDVYLLLDERLQVTRQLGHLPEGPAEPLPETALSACVAPESAEALETTLSSLLAERQSGEITTRWPDGSQTLWRAAPAATAGVVLSRVRSQRAPSEGGALMSMVDALPMMVASVDAELRYRFVNASYENFFGHSRDALRGRHIETILGEAALNRLIPIYERVLAGEQMQFEEALPLRDGSTMECRIQYVPDRAPDGRVTGFFAAIEDVSEYGATIRLLKQVHHIVHDTPIEHEGTVDELLTLALDYLGLEIGIISQVSGDTYTVRHVVSQHPDLKAGTQLPLGDTFCCLTLQADGVLGTVRAGEHPLFRGHPCYRHFPLESYIGVPLIIDGGVWGTLNFSSTEPRRAPFNELENELVRLVASAAEHLIAAQLQASRWAHEREHITSLAFTDALTGLPNRAALDEQLDTVAAQGTMHDHQSSVAIIDIDHFKRVNDNHGHDIGDRVLRALAGRLAQTVRDGDVIGRLGGEEFMVIMSDTSLEAATDIAERLRQAIQTMRVPMGDQAPLAITISLGVTVTRPDDTPEQIYRRADRALYAAKHQGRNRVEVR